MASSSTHLELLDLIEKGDKESVSELLEGSEDNGWLSERDSDGRTALDTAVILGQQEIVSVLIEKGAEINSANSSGYTAMHFGAIWGQLECVKVLVSLGADYHLTTRHKETVRDLASRYGNTKCVTYINCADARKEFLQLITLARETLSDSNRIAGKWNKDDKYKVTTMCNQKTDWLEKNPEATSEDITAQHKEFNEGLGPFMAKLPSHE